MSGCSGAEGARAACRRPDGAASGPRTRGLAARPAQTHLLVLVQKQQEQQQQQGHGGHAGDQHRREEGLTQELRAGSCRGQWGGGAEE